MTTRKSAAKESEEVEETGAEMVPYESLDLISWDDAAAGADTVLGRDLTKEDVFDKLVGVHFLITKLVTRPGKGVLDIKGKGEVQRDYFSCEARIAPAHVLQQRKVNLEELLPLTPDGLIVFNDSSTGIRRQIVQYLHASKKIALPEPVVVAGAMGESTYDLPVSEWADVYDGEIRFDENGFPIYTLSYMDGWKGLMCPRGIRLSDYSNKYTGDDTAVTRYLA